ncbi:MAG: DNA-directed RNA polymerase specialized sigma24 family protein [Polaribacter sp.]|jgi:hypothetical protein
MLDRLKPAWRMYQCQQKIEGIPSAEILAILDLEEETVNSNNSFAKRSWSVGIFVLLFLMTCCQGG